MASSSFDPRQASTWHWPDAADRVDVTAEPRLRVPGHFDADSSIPEPTKTSDPKVSESANEQHESEPMPQQRTYAPRTCRICLEVVYPTYHLPSENVPSFLQSRIPRVTYESEDPASGRLLRPCKCKGSSRYVHEGCLNQWRKADPAMSNRNYWRCPTCGFEYRLERMSWGRMINNTFTQIAMTLAIILIAIFLLGFVADPIINMYIDPYDTLAYGVEKITLDEEGNGTWIEHFLKGLASLGLIGLLKVLLAIYPWHWLNLRNYGFFNIGSNRQWTGRERVASMSWIVIVVGVMTFVWAVFKGVRAWSRRTLEMASERVMDVSLDGDDDDEEETPASSNPH